MRQLLASAAALLILMWQNDCCRKHWILQNVINVYDFTRPVPGLFNEVAIRAETDAARDICASTPSP